MLAKVTGGEGAPAADLDGSTAVVIKATTANADNISRRFMLVGLEVDIVLLISGLVSRSAPPPWPAVDKHTLSQV